MPPMSKVDLFAAIRRDSRAGLSVRGLARKYQISRPTIRSALTSAWPAPRKPMSPRPSKLDLARRSPPGQLAALGELTAALRAGLG